MKSFLPIPSGLIDLPLNLTWQSINPSNNRYRTFVLRVDESLQGNMSFPGFA